jgi:DNA-binding GntR family transcriptional regulator
VIDPSADRAVFRQLADLLREQILSGALQPGQALPSETRLTQDHGVSRNTVRQAVAVLRGEGLVTTDRPGGTRVRERPDRVIVEIASGTVEARMPTAAERRELDMAEGVPVLLVERDGQTELYAGDRTVLRISPDAENHV